MPARSGDAQQRRWRYHRTNEAAVQPATHQFINGRRRAQLRLLQLHDALGDQDHRALDDREDDRASDRVSDDGLGACRRADTTKCGVHTTVSRRAAHALMRSVVVYHSQRLTERKLTHQRAQLTGHR